MKRGDEYTNYGGETLRHPYVERSYVLPSGTRLVVRGVDSKDISDIVEKRMAELKRSGHRTISLNGERLALIYKSELETKLNR